MCEKLGNKEIKNLNCKAKELNLIVQYGEKLANKNRKVIAETLEKRIGEMEKRDKSAPGLWNHSSQMKSMQSLNINTSHISAHQPISQSGEETNQNEIEINAKNDIKVETSKNV